MQKTEFNSGIDINLTDDNVPLSNDFISNKFKELNVIVSEIIMNLKEDTDQNIKNEERTDQIINIFSMISDDMEIFKCGINEILDESSKEEFLEENKKLEIAFKIDFKKKPSQSHLAQDYEFQKKNNDEIIFKKEELKLISDLMKKDVDNINKEIVQQEKHIKLIKEGITKIQNIN